jgi:3-oxoacyl-[acyl-carrier protein] reductase
MVDSNLARVAVVTGGAKGIGLAISRRLLAAGHRVALFDIDVGAAEREARSLGPNAMAVAVDVTDRGSVDNAVNRVVDPWGGIDILVNNAGIAGPAAPVVDYPAAEWRRVLAINIDGVFNLTQAILPIMLKVGWGRIVNIASIAGKEGNPNMAAYSTSKAAVIGFTKAVAKEVASRGVLVNCVTPAVIETEILKQLTPEAIQYMVSKIPMARTGQPEEVAELVAWLASSACSFSTGAVFDISGGRATY